MSGIFGARGKASNLATNYGPQYLYCGNHNPAAAAQLALVCAIPFPYYTIEGFMVKVNIAVALGSARTLSVAGYDITDGSGDTGGISGSMNLPASVTGDVVCLFSKDAARHGYYRPGAADFATTGTALVAPGIFSSIAVAAVNGQAVIPATRNGILPNFTTAGVTGSEDISAEVWACITPAVIKPY